AFWTESYGGPHVQPLTSASGPYLHEHGFLTPRGALTIGRTGQGHAVEAFAARYVKLGVCVERLDRASLEDRIPGLLPAWTYGARGPSCCDIDVAGLHQHYLQPARRGGVELWSQARLVASQACADGWRLRMSGGRELRSTLLVN